MSWTSRNIALVAVLSSGMGLAVPASANLISDGSFETPVVSVGGFINVLHGNPLASGNPWTVVGAGAVSPISGSYVNGASFPAEDGVQWLDLTGDLSNSLTGVAQTVSGLTVGTLYDLSFWVGNQDISNIPGWGTTSTVEVFLDAASLGSFTNSNPSSCPAGALCSQVWEQFTTSFTASATTATLAFYNKDPSTDNTNGLDNVVLDVAGTPPPPSVPEPATLALVGLGLAGLGFNRRNKA